MKQRIKTVLFVTVIISTALIMGACSGKNVDISDSIYVSYSGLDGEGSAEANIDTTTVEYLISQDMDSTSANWGSLYALLDTMYVTLDKTDGLSNGDKITATLSYSEEALKNLNISISPKEKEFTVDGLIDATNLTKLDPFEALEVTFVGESGNAYVNINNNNSVSGLSFKADKTEDLSNGDEITITVEYDEMDLVYQGYALSKTSNKYKVEDLSEYITEISQISDDLIERMDKEAQDYYRADVAKNWHEKTSLKDIELVNQYLLVKKQGHSGYENILYMVYKLDGTIEGYKDFTTYMYAGFFDIVKTGDICTTDLVYFDIPEGSYSWGDVSGEAFIIGEDSDGDEWWTEGYKTEDDLRYNVIDKNVADYTYEILKEQN